MQDEPAEAPAIASTDAGVEAAVAVEADARVDGPTEEAQVDEAPIIEAAAAVVDEPAEAAVAEGAQSVSVEDEAAVPVEAGVPAPAEQEDEEDGETVEQDGGAVVEGDAGPATEDATVTVDGTDADGDVPAAPVAVDDVAGAAATSEPLLAPAIVPPPPSVSPVPAKKFASSLSVNKKFLEKAGDKGKSEVRAAATRQAAAPAAPVPTVSHHSRLLTGKILSGGPAIPIASPSASPGPTWGRPSPSPSNDTPTAPTGPKAPTPMGRGVSPIRRAIVWGEGRGRGGFNLSSSGMDFPTAAEAANAKALRQQAILEQIKEREAKAAARAAAAAAANAHLLEGLDAFRGIHLDPNAAHWDEEDEDDDYLDDTIEFGDGTQYKLDSLPADFFDPATAAPEEPAKADAPAAAAEPARPPRDEFDRSSWGAPRGAPKDDPKNLFNARLGSFEPYAGAGGAAAGRKGLTATPQILGSQQQTAGAKKAEELASKAVSPPARNDWHDREKITGRRPSTNAREVARPSQANGAPPSAAVDMDMRGGRELPPHLQQQKRDPPPHQAAPPAARPAARDPSPAKPAAVAPPAARDPSPAKPAAPAPPPEKEEDLQTLHAREMHAAAERAKVRRQQEEEERLAQMERAKAKAAALEERMKAEAAAKAAAAAPVAAASASPTRPAVAKAGAGAKATDPAKQSPADLATSWRRSETAATPSTNASSRKWSDAAERPDRKMILTREGESVAPGAGRDVPPHQAAAAAEAQVNGEPTSPRLDNKEKPASPSSPQQRPRSTSKASAGDSSKIDDVMSRIKGAMTASSSATTSPNEEPADPLPVVSLPKKKAAEAPRDPNAPQLTVNLPKRRVLASSSDVPATVVEEPVIVAPPRATPSPEAERRSAGSSISRPRTLEPPPQVEGFSRVERPASPPPVWKLFAIKLPKHTSRETPPAWLTRAFDSPLPPVQVLSWSPPIANLTRKMTRDDLFFTKRYTLGKLVTEVHLTKGRLVRRDKEAVAPMLAPKLSSAFWAAQPVEFEFDMSSAPTDDVLFEQPKAAPTHKRDDSFPSAFEGTLGSGALGGTIEEVVRPEKTLFGLSSADEPQLSALSNLLPIPDGAPASSTASTMWQTTPPTFSLLDPAAQALWSAPSTNEVPVHSRSVSMGGPVARSEKPSSLGDDIEVDFATMPTSLAELKTEAESSESEKTVTGDDSAAAVPAEGPEGKDAARLRAMAPSFTSYSDFSNRAPVSEARLPHSAALSPGPMYSTMDSQMGYSPYALPPNSHPYAAFSPYATSMSQHSQGSHLSPTPGAGYSQAFASSPLPSLSPSSPRPIGYSNITNPALIANYANYGAIGAGMGFKQQPMADNRGVIGGGRPGAYRPAVSSPSALPSLDPYSHLARSYMSGPQLVSSQQPSAVPQQYSQGYQAFNSAMPQQGMYRRWPSNF